MNNVVIPKRYNIEVLVKSTTHDGVIEVWKKVCPTGGQPYVFTDENRAYITLRSLYPDLPRESVRIVEAE